MLLLDREVARRIIEERKSKMSASFRWEIVKPSRAKTFDHGTSSDVEALAATFENPITAKDIPTLRAMHRATRLKESLWNDTAIKVWVEY